MAITIYKVGDDVRSLTLLPFHVIESAFTDPVKGLYPGHVISTTNLDCGIRAWLVPIICGICGQFRRQSVRVALRSLAV